MPESTAPEEQELVSCEICLTSIPKECAEHAETDDYVAHFCGLECYDIWVKQNPKPESSAQPRNK